jgi:transcriptional regulator with XRE-family HTH domain
MVKIDSPASLGAALRQTRTALHIPAADMAAMVNTNHVTLRKLEQGNATSAISTLFALLDELGLELHISFPPGVDPIVLTDRQDKPRRTRVQP